MPAGSGSAVGVWIVEHRLRQLAGREVFGLRAATASSGAISGATIGIGESCQFQKRVRSICSAALKRPSTASANTPPDGSGMISLFGAGRSSPRA